MRFWNDFDVNDVLTVFSYFSVRNSKSHPIDLPF